MAGNLDARGQNTQLRFGVVLISFALAAAVALLWLGVAPGYRSFLAFPFFLGTYGVYAGLTRTCGFSALRGVRITESGTTPIGDKGELEVFRKRGWQVIGGSATIAAAATALLVLAH